jgi:hypothetical protein
MMIPVQAGNDNSAGGPDPPTNPEILFHCEKQDKTQ